VVIDDSAGMPLKETPLASFLRLGLEAASGQLAPLALLSLLKHPLAEAGMERIVCLETARTLEMLVLRGLRINGGIDGIRQALLKGNPAPPEVHALLDRLDDAFAPLLALLARGHVPLGELLKEHLSCMELIGGELWNGPEADALAKLLWEIEGACAADGLAIEAESYPAVFEELLAGKVVRPDYGMHPRLKILSPMEARMQSFDRTVLGGLNEGSWPPAPGSDPWFSRPMRAQLGLPAPERGLALAAHDFSMLACGCEVFLTRSGKEGGVPTLPSRWLVKLDMLTGGLRDEGEKWLRRAAMLDAPREVKPMAAPAPTPLVSARPREISVTQVETWMRDPYALYASQVLRLKPLELIGRAPDGSDFGNAVHEALERFVRSYPHALPADALPVLLVQGREAFAELFAATGMEVLWWPRFVRIARWFVDQEETRRAALKRVSAEIKGTWRIGDFLLKGRADRVEEGTDGSLTIVDYKTGGLPAMKDIEGGLASQLVLLALMAREGDLGARGEPILIEYWRLRGTGEIGEIEPVKPEKIEGYMEEAKAGLMDLIRRYSDPSFPYLSMPIPSRAARYRDYDHLARVKEWG
jgi:ATP-dependent helicase/nuclease subunit B